MYTEPAYPVLPPVCSDGNSPAGYPYPDAGMTLLDHFAGQAMAAQIAASSGAEVRWPEPRRVAKAAYDYAIALIEEKHRREGR